MDKDTLSTYDEARKTLKSKGIKTPQSTTKRQLLAILKKTRDCSRLAKRLEREMSK